MLAYVFWHWPQSAIPSTEYDAHLREFHHQLSLHKPAGFHSSAAFRIRGAAWLPAEAAYEDWYLLDGSTALDILNDAAVTAPLKESHDRSAHLAAGGTAGLYRLRLGSGLLAVTRRAVWFAKPARVTYDQLYNRLRPLVDAGASLWGRQMTLGPTPEFCLHTCEDQSIEVESLRVALSPVWL